MHWLPSSPYPGSPTLPPRTPRSNCMFTDEGHVGMKRVCVCVGGVPLFINCFKFKDSPTMAKKKTSPGQKYTCGLNGNC